VEEILDKKNFSKELFKRTFQKNFSKELFKKFSKLNIRSQKNFSKSSQN